MTTLADLMSQKAQLEEQIKSMASEQRGAAITQIRALMADHGLSLADLAAKASSAAKKSSGQPSKVAVKYRDPESGNAWTGRGLRPKWLTAAIEGGKRLEDFAI